ncbi:hypothetical protein GGI21_005381 [Coemansia aciculifera]|nr:hypothetical protein GGI21_005381 [Coemansia aciculifera]
MSTTQPVEVQSAASSGSLSRPQPGTNRTEAQQERVAILMDLMGKLVEHMDTFSAIQIQNPHVPQTATQVKDILAVLLPEITTMGPLLLEHEQTQVMSMLHHVTQRVDAVWKAQVQTQTGTEAQAACDDAAATGVNEANRETLMKQSEASSRDDDMVDSQAKESQTKSKKSAEKYLKATELLAKKKDIDMAALRAKAVMKATLSECLAELNNDLRVEMKKRYL